MDLSTARANHEAVIFDRFGVDAFIHPRDGSNPRAVRIRVHPDVERLGDGGYVEVRSEVQVRRVEVDQPEKGDRYTAPEGESLPGLQAGQSWVVDDYEPSRDRWIQTVRKN